MKKNIVMTLILLSFLGCSDKKPTPQTAIKKSFDVNKTETKSTVSVDFIPEHIKQSKIEVVKRY